MNNVLIDSSVWIHYFRQSDSTIGRQVDLLLDEDRVALCGMVELEILQGIRGKERNKIQGLFGALHFIDTERHDFIFAGLMLNQLRTKGIIIPSSDCLVAAQCIHHRLPLYTLDNDFKHIHSLTSLSLLEFSQP
jgi:hypothetical protein